MLVREVMTIPVVTLSPTASTSSSSPLLYHRHDGRYGLIVPAT